MRRWLLLFGLLLLTGCASEMVVRARPDRVAPPESVLASIDPVRIRLAVDGVARDSGDAVGTRTAGLGQPESPVYLTRAGADVLREMVAEELRAAGHTLVDEGEQVDLTVVVQTFDVDLEPRSLVWDVTVEIRMALVLKGGPASHRVEGEYVLTAERQGSSLLWPSIGSTERIVSECLDDLAELVADREGLANALAQAAAAGA